MKVLIRANPQQQQEFLYFNTSSTLVFVNKIEEIAEADVYIDCLFEEKEPIFTAIETKPVLVGCLLKTNAQLAPNFVRINTWFGSIKKNIWEFSFDNESLKPAIETFCEALNIKPIFVHDSIGLIVAPTITMIVNEAYFALEDEISTKHDIDIAMKLGTNYPFGPFEWAEKIGLRKIYDLLNTLQQQDAKYTPCSLLKAEALAL